MIKRIRKRKKKKKRKEEEKKKKELRSRRICVSRKLHTIVRNNTYIEFE